jgi:hypothetical protein
VNKNTVLFFLAICYLFMPLAAFAAEVAQPATDQQFIFERQCGPKAAEADPGNEYAMCPQIYKMANNDAAAFLDGRVYALINRTTTDRDKAFLKYEIAAWTSFGFAIVAAVLTIFNFSWIGLKNLVATAAFLLIAVSTSFGWNQQYRAEYQVVQSLKSLHNEINVDAIQAANTKTPISSEQLESLIRDYRTIMDAHAKGYTDSFSAPSFGSAWAKLLGLDVN